MISSNVQEIYDMHIAGLSAGERLRLVEMITRGMAQNALDEPITVPDQVHHDMPGWQAADRRGDNTEWRDRAL
jgi:hypothetical protein